MRPRAHDRFSSEVQLDPAMVSAFATSAGDDNPVHHDPRYAAQSRFGRLIASGPHTSALLLALTAKHFSQLGPMLGLEFWLRFRSAAFADERIKLEWLVIRVTPNQKLAGDIVELRGRIVGADGRTVLGAKGKVLVQAA